MSGMLQSLCALLSATPPPGGEFSGQVHGGWGYVAFSYGLAWVSLLGYAVYLLRLRHQLKALPPEVLPPEGKPKPSSSPSAS
jgi:hypothetical protein